MTVFILNHSIIFSLHWLKSDGSLLIFSFINCNKHETFKSERTYGKNRTFEIH